MNKDFEFKNGTIISIWEEISQIFHVRKFNWCTLNFINFEIEYDRHLGAIEIMFIIAGFGIRIRMPIKTDKSEKEWAKINKSMKSLKDSFYAWALDIEIDNFKSKKSYNIRTTKYLKLYRTRKIARNKAKQYIVPDNVKVKKLFIQ